MTRIFTNTFYGKCKNQNIDVNIDVIESYDYIKDIIYEYTKNKFIDEFDGFIELHFAKGKFINKPILIKLSSIEEIFDISEEESND